MFLCPASGAARGRSEDTGNDKASRRPTAYRPVAAPCSEGDMWLELKLLQRYLLSSEKTQLHAGPVSGRLLASSAQCTVFASRERYHRVYIAGPQEDRSSLLQISFRLKGDSEQQD